MPRPSRTLSDDFARELRALEATRSKIELLAAGGALSQRDVLRTYQGLFLAAIIAFERFLEDLFIGLLVENAGVASSRLDVVPRISVKSFKVAREVVLGPKLRYISWLPFSNTSELASVFFRGGRPFTDVGQPGLQALTRCHYIRNAIAHRSRHSLGQFQRHVIGGLSIPPRERHPMRFLRGTFRANPAQTRYENLIIQLANVSRDLAR